MIFRFYLLSDSPHYSVISKSFHVRSGLFRLTSVVLLYRKIFGRLNFGWYYFRTLFLSAIFRKKCIWPLMLSGIDMNYIRDKHNANVRAWPTTFLTHFFWFLVTWIYLVDVDECSASISVCDDNANCKNTRGSYRCSCKAGFTGDGKTCAGENINIIQ